MSQGKTASKAVAVVIGVGAESGLGAALALRAEFARVTVSLRPQRGFGGGKG